MSNDPVNRPRSRKVEVVATVVGDQTLWAVSVSDLTTDEVDSLLTRLTRMNDGDFKAYLETNPDAAKYARTGVAP